MSERHGWAAPGQRCSLQSRVTCRGDSTTSRPSPSHSCVPGRNTKAAAAQGQLPLCSLPHLRKQVPSHMGNVESVPGQELGCSAHLCASPAHKHPPPGVHAPEEAPVVDVVQLPLLEEVKEQLPALVCKRILPRLAARRRGSTNLTTKACWSRALAAWRPSPCYSHNRSHRTHLAESTTPGTNSCLDFSCLIPGTQDTSKDSSPSPTQWSQPWLSSQESIPQPPPTLQHQQGEIAWD